MPPPPRPPFAVSLRRLLPVLLYFQWTLPSGSHHVDFGQRPRPRTGRYSLYILFLTPMTFDCKLGMLLILSNLY
ncbi:hypothetical protein PHAVU_011G115200 [Phaseolus vulgaris]|uniref:Uncharacterized protein n=1 Tax=Phaseolus vulgaris TaxID=3885 RepID=V7AKP4_PHAVU|nr:hypothetical protein PHAVU_011G115200g [Phaseolus vulgaris]ESW04671.1 hypothetical protein PHAVU_011G115200g [Phaseolus vulgaris]